MIFGWCGRCFGTEICSPGWPRSDIGSTLAATLPGNFNAKATESFQEGFLIPPVKLPAQALSSRTSSTFSAANSRVPQSNWGDLNGQLNALDLGERRFHALLKEYGGELIVSALDLLTARAEKLMRANITT